MGLIIAISKVLTHVTDVDLACVEVLAFDLVGFVAPGRKLSEKFILVVPIISGLIIEW